MLTATRTAAAVGVLALASLPVQVLAKDHRPDPAVTSIVVHFHVTSEKTMDDAVTLTALDDNGTVVGRTVVQPSQADWPAQREVQIQVNPMMSVPISHLNGGKIHIDSGNPTAWAANIQVFATLSDGTTREVVSETMQPANFNWTGQNGYPFWETSFINAGQP